MRHAQAYTVPVQFERTVDGDDVGAGHVGQSELEVEFACRRDDRCIKG